MKTVTVNGRVLPVEGNIIMFVHKLELSRKAIITWVDSDNCVITDKGAKIDRPMVSLSSGYKTVINGSAK